MAPFWTEIQNRWEVALGMTAIDCFPATRQPARPKLAMTGRNCLLLTANRFLTVAARSEPRASASGLLPTVAGLEDVVGYDLRPFYTAHRHGTRVACCFDRQPSEPQ